MLRRFQRGPGLKEGLALSKYGILAIVLVLPWTVRPLRAQCADLPTVWMDEQTAESHLLSKRDLAVPARPPRLARIGKVILTVTVDRAGTICDVKAVTGPEDLRATAMKIVKEHWRFRRFLVDWKPVVAQFPVTVSFVLPGGKPHMVACGKIPSFRTTQGSLI